MLAFPLFLLGQLVSDGQLDHLHAKDIPECLLRAVEHSPECSTLIAQNYLTISLVYSNLFLQALADLSP